MKHIIMDVIVDGISYNPPAPEPKILLTGFFWILCLTFAGFLLYFETRKKPLLSVFLKGLASLCFVLLGILGYEICNNYSVSENVLLGLCLGMIADILLNLRYVFLKFGQKIFLAGILVFLAGHVMYIIALAPMSWCLTESIIAAVVLTAVLVWRVYLRINATLIFRIFGVFYLGAIVVMTCIALGILFTDPSAFSGIFSAGALLFLASDIILILNVFGSKSKNSLRIANIILYYTGQLLIATSLQFI